MSTYTRSGSGWRAMVVQCDVRLNGCNATYSTQTHADETEAAARKRALDEALAGRWMRVKRVLYCPRCAAASGKVPT